MDRLPSAETNMHVCTNKSQWQVSPPPPCTHIFIKMWLLEMTGSLGNDRLKLKSSNNTLRGTISQLNAEWKEPQWSFCTCKSSAQIIFAEKAAVRTPRRRSKHFCCKLRWAQPLQTFAFRCVMLWLSFARMFHYVCYKQMEMLIKKKGGWFAASKSSRKFICQEPIKPLSCGGSQIRRKGRMNTDHMS